MTAEPLPAPPDGAPPQRFEFATTDPDEAQDFIEQMWPPGRRRPGGAWTGSRR